MVIRHMITIFVLGTVVTIPLWLVTISSNDLIPKEDNQSLVSTNSSSVELNSINLEMLSLLSDIEMYRSGDLTGSVYLETDRSFSNTHSTNSSISQESLPSNLLTADLNIDQDSLLLNDISSSDKNIYITIDSMGNIDQKIVSTSNNLVETELLISNNSDVSSVDKNIYITVDDMGNIDQEITVAVKDEEHVINQDIVSDMILVNIDNTDSETVESIESVGVVVTDKTAETVLLRNNYRDISMNERDIYSSLVEVDNSKVAENIVVAKIDKEQFSDQSTVLERVFTKVDIADNIDIGDLETVETVEAVKPFENIESVDIVETFEKAEVLKEVKKVETELFVNSDNDIISNDINLYSSIDMLDTSTIEMIAYSNYVIEDKKVIEVSESVTEKDSIEVSSIKIKELAVKDAEAKYLQVAVDTQELEVREHETNLTNLALAGNITQEFASLSPSLVNRSLSIDLSVGRTDIETPSSVKGIENIDNNLVLTDTLKNQKSKIEVIVVDRSIRDIKDERYYYSESSIAPIPSTVLELTEDIKAEGFHMLDFSREFYFCTTFVSPI